MFTREIMFWFILYWTCIWKNLTFIKTMLIGSQGITIYSSFLIIFDKQLAQNEHFIKKCLTLGTCIFVVWLLCNFLSHFYLLIMPTEYVLPWWTLTWRDTYEFHFGQKYFIPQMTSTSFQEVNPLGRGPIIQCDIQTWYKMPLIVFLWSMRSHSPDRTNSFLHYTRWMRSVLKQKWK